MRLISISKTFLKKTLCTMGFEIIRLKKTPYPHDIAEEEEFIEIYKKCKPYTMISIERMYSLYKAIEYVVKNKIPGDMVECGVWRGGSSMFMAYTLLKMKTAERKIYLYDTYAGATEPGDFDIRFDGELARKEWLANVKKGIRMSYAPLEDVKDNLFSTGYPKEKLIFVEGDIRNTIPGIMPDKISVLRLDTDWYELTYYELCHLFPRLSAYGIVIIDDFGFLKGVRKAVDEYFQKNNINILLDRIDDTGRIGIKSSVTF